MFTNRRTRRLVSASPPSASSPVPAVTTTATPAPSRPRPRDRRPPEAEPATPTTVAPADTEAPTSMAPADTEPWRRRTAAGGADIVDTAVGAGDFTTLVAAVQAAGLEETLRGEGPFTVFAPTDDAFAALPAGTVDTLLADPTGT